MFGGLSCPNKTVKPETIETQLDLWCKGKIWVGHVYVGVDTPDSG